MKTRKRKQYPHKSFYMMPADQEMLAYLVKVYGMNGCSVMRKLVQEAYAILKYVEQKEV